MKKLNILNNIYEALDIPSSNLSSPISKRKRFLIYILVYTAFFSIICLVGLRVFWVDKKSFIWQYDGLLQHIVIVRYFAQYWHTVIVGLFSGKLQLPMFDFSIGMGNDIIQALLHYGIGDVFHLTTAFVPTRYIEYYYNVIAILRPYLAGITFSILCMYAKRKNWAILLGALSYVFCGFVLFAGFRHPFFIIPLIYAPLLFLGLDFILQRKSPFLFIISIFLMGLTGFYFLYMISIFLVAYALVRLHHLYGKDFFRQLPPTVIKSVLSYSLGLCMSAILFLPGILAFLNSFRNQTVSDLSSIIWFYNTNVYVRRFFGLISTENNWDYLGMSAITLVALVLLLIKKNDKTHRNHLIMLVLFATIIYISPFGGTIMNGFGYRSDRWTFLFALLLSFITVYMLPDMLSLKRREYAAILILICLYGTLTVFIRESRSIYTMMAFVMLLLSISAFSVSNSLKLKPSITILALSLIILANLSANALFTFNNSLRNYASQFIAYGDYMKRYNSTPVLPRKISDSDNDFYRVDVPQGYANSPLFFKYNGLKLYWSMSNKIVMEGNIELDNIRVANISQITGFDERTVLNGLASVKYYIKNQGNLSPVPYGYKLHDESGSANTYINEYALPLGYTYDKSISYDDYRALDTLDKQEALLQTVVLDEKYKNSHIGDFNFTSEEIAYTYETNNLLWENNILDVKNDNASITLLFEGKNCSETYVRLSGIVAGITMTYKASAVSKTITTLSVNDSFSFGRTDYLCNLGYNVEALTSVTITFGKKGKYKLDDIKIECYPMNNYANQIAALKEEVLSNINVSANRVTGTINVSENKFLVLSIPYSSGWSAKVDGIKTEILQANTMFMALPLTAGEHSIELVYCTPGIILGLILSVSGIIIFIILVIFYRLHRRNSRAFPHTTS